MPELRYLTGVVTLRLEAERCVGCGLCLEVCPQAVLALVEGKAVIADRDACMECGACALNCPAGALMVQAGVGCAQAVINAALGRGGGSGCSCQPDSKAVGGPPSKGGCCC